MQAKKINIIGLGGQSSGADFLYRYIASHPQTCILKRQTRFFSDAQRFGRGSQWYEEQFVECKQGKVRGECAYGYLANPQAAERIVKEYAGARLVAVICNPVERLHREYLRAKAKKQIASNITFMRYLEVYPDALERGLFGKQLQVYFSYFSQLQIHIAVHEDRHENPVEYVQSAYRFLGLSDTYVPPALRPFARHDADEPVKRPFWIRFILFFLAPLRWFKLDKLLFWLWKVTAKPVLEKRGWLKKDGSQPPVTTEKRAPISDELRTVLYEYYQDDVRYLSQLLERDLLVEWDMLIPENTTGDK